MCWWIATMLMPAFRSALSTPCSSLSSIAKSPSTIAWSSLPANAAQVLTPMAFPMVWPAIFTSRPMVTLYTPLFDSPLLPRTASIFFGSSVLLAGSMFAEGTSNFCSIVSNIFATPAASFASSPMPPMCMNMTRGCSQKKWLCRAVTRSPLSSAALIAGFTWSSVSTMSPMTTVCAPAFVKAAQAVRPRGGIILVPAVVTARSLRGISTLKTPSFSFHLPLTPVICSIRAVSRPFLAAAAGSESRAIAISVLLMLHLLSDHQRPSSVLCAPAVGALALVQLVEVVEHRARAREAILVLPVRHRDRIDDQLESLRFGSPIGVDLEVDVVDDFGDRPQRCIGDLEAAKQHLERAQLALVRVLAVEHVEAQLALFVPVLVRRHELELRVRIDEPADEPRARHAIDVDPRPGDPGAAARPFDGPGLLHGRRLGRREALRELLQEARGRFAGTAMEEVDGGDLGEPTSGLL